MRLCTDPTRRLNEALDHLEVHDHFALIYRSDEEKFETLLPFIRNSIERGDRYLYLSSESDRRLLLEMLQRHGIDTAAALSRGTLVLTTPFALLRQDRPLGPELFIELLSEAVAAASSAGFPHLRLCVEKLCTLGSLSDVDSVDLMLDYETRLDLFIRNNSITALCAYDAKRFSSRMLRDVIRTHPKLVMQGVLCSNYGYLPPEELLHPNRLDFEVGRLLKGMLETELHLYDLQMQNDMFRSMFQNTLAMAYVKDLQGRYLLVNPVAAAFLGGGEADLQGLTDAELLSAPSAHWTAMLDRQAMASDRPVVTLEWLTARGETRTFWITRGAYRRRDGSVVGVFGIAADITERRKNEIEIRRYEEQLRAKVAEVSRVEEQERRRIAAALHDEIGQTLALAKIKLETLRGLQGGGELELGIAKVRELLDGVIGETRSLTVELRPPLLYELGLETAIQGLCEEFRQQYGIDFSFENDAGEKRVSDDLRIFLYRAVRELLVNVVKHSRASRARVTLCRRDCWLTVMVIDNGAGFDQEAAESRIGVNTGFGLFSIRERVLHLGGRFAIRSRLGEGTKVIVDAPYESPAAASG